MTIGDPASHHPQIPPPPGVWDRRRHGDVAPIPWTWLDALVVFLVVAVLVVVLATLLSGLLEFGVVSEAASDVLFLMLTFVVLTAVSLLWVRVRYPGGTRRLGGARRARGIDWLLALGLGVGAYLALNVVVGLLVQIAADLLGVELPTVQPELRRFAQDTQLAPYFAVSAILFAPIAEELFFRGLLFQALRKSIGVWPGILVSSVLFSLAHVSDVSVGANLLVLVPIFPLGVLLAWLMHTRETLLVPIVVHAVFNAIGVMLLIAFG